MTCFLDTLLMSQQAFKFDDVKLIDLPFALPWWSGCQEYEGKSWCDADGSYGSGRGRVG